ncbi:MAG: 2-polyprenylphenol 6-hydroxylase [Gammaproteobacteria bacterium]|nr:2-polyprenylphenol 6-hydroxylase [Gammaproteobacteria bacterium]
MKSLQILARLFKTHQTLIRYQLDVFFVESDFLKPLRWVFLISPSLWFRKKTSLTKGERLRLALEDLGPLYVKFGQSLSTRPDLLPEDIASELSKLQDKVPPFSGEVAEQEIFDAFGKKPKEIFADFDKEAFASASIAQAHLATLHSGEEVVVKILRPNIWEAIEKDMEILFLFARLLENYSDESKRLKPMEVVRDYQTSVMHELDLLREAANCSQIGRNWEGSEIIKVPKIYKDYCKTNVLVQERIYGIPISDVQQLMTVGVDLKKLATNGVRIFFTQVFHHNLFHADMHPGNVFVDISNPDKPLYAAVDFGIVGSLNDLDRRYLALSFSAFFEKDYKSIASNFLAAGWVPSETRLDTFEASIRTVCEPIADKPLEEISFGQVLISLFQTAREFKMENQPQLVQLEKTLLNIEGLGRQLYPKLDIVAAAKPVISEWREQQTDLKTILTKLQQDAPEIRKTIEELPSLAKRVINSQNNNQSNEEFFNQFSKTVYKSLLGIAVMIMGGILLGLEIVLGWLLMGAGFLVILLSKPK